MKADDEGLAVSLSRRIYSGELLSGKPLQSTQETLPRAPPSIAIQNLPLFLQRLGGGREHRRHSWG